jgi:hypothetical protein
VLFADRNLDLWFANGSESAPLDARCHDLSDAIVLVGISPSNGSLPAQESGASNWRLGGANLGLKGGKITFKNEAKTLLALIEGLIDVVKTITVVDPISGALPITPSIVVQLEAQKAQFELLLNS